MPGGCSGHGPRFDHRELRGTPVPLGQPSKTEPERSAAAAASLSTVAGTVERRADEALASRRRLQRAGRIPLAIERLETTCWSVTPIAHIASLKVFWYVAATTPRNDSPGSSRGSSAGVTISAKVCPTAMP